MTPEEKQTFLDHQQTALESINILCSLIKKATPNLVITPLIFGNIFKQIHAKNIDDPNFTADDHFLQYFD